MSKPSITIYIGERCLDYPKGASIPRTGDNVFIEGYSGTVTHANYHVNDDRLTGISIYATQKQ